MSSLIGEMEAHVELKVAEALATTTTGVLVLVEPGTRVSRLEPELLRLVEGSLPEGSTVHLVSEELVALVCPQVTLFQGWSCVEAVRQHFDARAVPLTVGLAAWPLHGPTVTDVFGAAAAALVDDRARLHQRFVEDVDRLLELDGEELTWSMAGELLSA